MRKGYKGETSRLERIFIQDTSGNPITGLVYNSSGLTAYYIREGDASSTAISLATMTLGTWATSGFVEVDATHMPGLYEVGIPIAALASGRSVTLYFRGYTNMAPCPLEIELDLMPYHLAAVPAVAAGASGGLPTVNASNQVAGVSGNVVGSVGSVTTVSDKTGYALTSAEHTLISGTDVPAGLTARGLTAALVELLAASAGSWTLAGNVLTMTSFGGGHTFTVTVDSVTNPTTWTVVQTS